MLRGKKIASTKVSNARYNFFFIGQVNCRVVVAHHLTDVSHLLLFICNSKESVSAWMN